MHNQSSAQAGFSLLEMLIAVLILAVGLIGLAELQITAMKGNSKSGSVMAATLVAQTAIEDIMAIGTDGDALFSLLTETTAETDWPVDPVRTLDGSGRYRITYETTDDIGGADSDIVRVVVTVRSLDGTGYGETVVAYQALKDLKRIVEL